MDSTPSTQHSPLLALPTVAESLDGGLSWRYLGVALHEEGWSLSHPFVFSWNGAVYMLPQVRCSANCRLLPVAPHNHRIPALPGNVAQPMPATQTLLQGEGSGALRLYKAVDFPLRWRGRAWQRQPVSSAIADLRCSPLLMPLLAPYPALPSPPLIL